MPIFTIAEIFLIISSAVTEHIHGVYGVLLKMGLAGGR
jgi:hypothetical protein